MEITFYFKHAEVSNPLKLYTKNKLEKHLQKFHLTPIIAKITFSIERDVYKSHCNLISDDGTQFNAEHASKELIDSVDIMLDKLIRQIREHKNKNIDHLYSKNNFKQASY